MIHYFKATVTKIHFSTLIASWVEQSRVVRSWKESLWPLKRKYLVKGDLLITINITWSIDYGKLRIFWTKIPQKSDHYYFSRKFFNDSFDLTKFWFNFHIRNLEHWKVTKWWTAVKYHQRIGMDFNKLTNDRGIRGHSLQSTSDDTYVLAPSWSPNLEFVIDDKICIRFLNHYKMCEFCWNAEKWKRRSVEQFKKENWQWSRQFNVKGISSKILHLN